MPVFRLDSRVLFPPVHMAREDGILAVGGDLQPERLLLAYSNGIFPWYSEGEPIIWWSPDPRFVIFPHEIVINKSLRKVIKKEQFSITYDTAFRQVMEGCGGPRKHEDGTWITPEMLEAYCRLHELGFAHSVEAWFEGELAGGLYGISLGKAFFGESMFTRVSNASKVAFVTLAKKLMDLDFAFIDSQVHTDHLQRFGAVHIPREDYIDLLSEALKQKTLKGNWGKLLQ